MTGACEVLSVIAILSTIGETELDSRCVASMEACNARWQEMADAGNMVIGQCFKVDDLIAMRDAGRKPGTTK